MKIIISVHLCTFALFHICIFICVFFVFILLFCVEFKVTPFILLYIFSFFLYKYIYFLVSIIIIINFSYFCISNSNPKTNFENGIRMYIPKRQNKEYEPKTCDFFLALLNHPEDITY